MCSSSVDSGTSWAECASGSVNENGAAVCACVSVCGRACACVCLLFTVVQWHVTVGELSVGEGLESEPQRVALQLNSAMQCSTAHPPRMKLYRYPSRINTLSLYIVSHSKSCSLRYYFFHLHSCLSYPPSSLNTVHSVHHYVFFPLTYLVARGSLILLLIHTHSSNKEVRVKTVEGRIYSAVFA